jgi:hypothetical protein
MVWKPEPVKILFLTHYFPNYVADLLLHGLRKLLGPGVVDFPRKDCLYDGVLGIGVCPDNQRCDNWFPTDESGIDRDDMPSKIRNGYFDLIVCDYRCVPDYAEQLDKYANRIAIIDGEDQPQNIPTGRHVIFRRETDGADFSIPLPMALPEEIFRWIEAYDGVPKKYSIGFLGSTADEPRHKAVELLCKWYPDALMQATALPTAHAPEPLGRFGRGEYYRRLQQCGAVLSLAGKGYDTFRFWENAACNSIHCCQRMPLYIPQSFSDSHMIWFDHPAQMRKKLDAVLESVDCTRAMIATARYHLLKHHLTTHRALYFIDKVKQAFHS